MEERDILKQIRKLMEEKKDVSKELEEIQKECNHREGYEVRFMSGTNEVRRICKTCQKEIGYPTEQELKENGFI